MARIRSVHPSLFTDEAWVSCSPLARLLYIGLWTDADDQGLFEWKPLQIKMRLLPGDMAEAGALLDELAGVGLIAPFTHDGKRYGAIKQFRRFQRPKKPNAIHFLPPEWREYVCLSEPGPEPTDDEPTSVPNQFPTVGEKSPQMEDGGWRGGEEVSDANASSVANGDDERAGFDELWVAYRHHKGRSSKPKSRAAYGLVPHALKRQLAMAAQRFSREIDMPNGPPALEKWLADERYLDWLSGDDGRAAMPTFAGPSDVREAFVVAKGEAWVGSYLDRCAWQDVPERTLLPASQIAGDRLVKEAAGVLADLGLTVRSQAA